MVESKRRKLKQNTKQRRRGGYTKPEAEVERLNDALAMSDTDIKFNDIDDDYQDEGDSYQSQNVNEGGAPLRGLQLGGLNILDALTQVTTISQQN